MNTDCTHCLEQNSMRMNRSEGNIVCLECGYVSEYDSWIDYYSEYEPPVHNQHTIYDTFDFVPYTTFPDMVLQVAYEIYEKQIREHTYRGKVKRAIIANCLLNACIVCGVPKTNKDMAEICDTESAMIVKYSNHIECATESDSTSTLMVSKYIYTLPLPKKVHMQYIKQVKELFVDDNILEGKSPNTRLTTFIYIVGQQLNYPSINKQFIVATFDISIVTLNKALKEFLTNSSNF